MLDPKEATSGRMYLATTALTEFWETGDDLLFLGQWCLRPDRQGAWKNVRGEMLADPWADRRRIVQAFRYCTGVFDHVLAQLMGYLNHVHGVSYTSRYWRIIVGPWLLQYIQILYERYVRVQAALERDPHCSTTCLSPKCFVTPRDLEDFIQWHADDAYNLQLYSQVLQCVRRTLPDKSWEQDLAPKLSKSSRFLGGTVRRSANRLAAHFASSVVIGHVNISPSNLWKIMQRSGFAICPIVAEVPNHRGASTIPALREGLSSLTWRDEFESIVMKTLPVNLPILYLEGYKPFRQQCLSGWRRVPKTVLTENGWYTDESFKFRAAEWADAGAVLLGIQHGGAYGTSSLVPLEWHERAITDRFFTWGWAGLEEDRRLSILPHPRLCALGDIARKPANDRGGLLLVSSVFPRYPVHLHTQPIGDQVQEYLEDKITFIEQLSLHLRRHTTVRLHGIDYGWAVKQRLTGRCPDVKLGDWNVPLKDQLASCRVAACDYPGTAYLELLISNTPCILFWNPGLWEERDSAVPYFAALRRALILHDDAKAAAHHASEIYQNPWGWWGRESVQKARRQFIERFAYTSKDWAELWVKALRLEADTSGASPYHNRESLVS